MRLITGTRTRILADLTFGFDPAGATVELEVDDNGTLYPATWTGPAVAGDGEWTRTAQSDGFFVAGPVPDDELAGAVELPLGRHFTTAHVTNAGTPFVTPSTVIDVVDELRYVTVGELRDHLASAGGAGSRTAAVLPDDRLAVKLEEATAEVLGRLAGGYVIRAGATPPMLRTIIVAIAAYLATLEFYGSQPVEDRDPIVLGYARARELLTQLARGALVIDGIDPAQTGRGEGDPEIYQGVPSTGLADVFADDPYRGRNMPAYHGGVWWE